LLSEIVVSVFSAVLSLQVLLLDQDVDALLDHLNLRLEPEIGIKLRIKFRINFRIKV
jgi:hypothetical protein